MLTINMKEKIYNSSYFRNLFFSYLSILIILLLLGSHFIFNIYLDQFKQSILTEYTISTNRSTSYLDKEFDSISSMLNHLNGNSTLKPFKLKNNPLASIALQEQLMNATVINKNVFEIFLYYKSDNYLHSSSTSIALSYLNLIYSLDGYSNDELVALLKDCSYPMYLPTQNLTYRHNDSILNNDLILPILYPFRSSGTLMVFVDGNQLLSPIPYDEYTYVSILDSHNNTILSTLPEDLKTITSSLLEKESYTVVTLGEKKYLYTQSVSSDTGLSYIYLTDYMSLFLPFYKYIFFSILIIMVIVLILLLLVFYFTNKHYQPIRSLKALSNAINNFSLNDTDKFNNEFAYIQSTLEYLNESNKSLNSKYETTKYYGYDSLLFGLINGSFNSLEEFNEKGKSFDLLLDNGLYTLLVIRFTQDTLLQIDLYEILSEHYSNYSSDLTSIYIQKHLEKNKLIILITQEKADAEQLKTFTQDLQALLISHHVGEVHIGVGNTYDHFNFIPKSYIEAFNALKYRFIKSSTPVIYFKECILDKASTTFYTDHYVQSLKDHIVNEHLSDIGTTIDRLKAEFKDRQLPLFAVQGICFDMINDIFSYFNQHHLNSTHKLPPVNFYELSNYDTLEKLFEFVTATCFKISNTLERTDLLADKSTDNTQIKEMIQYIETRCCNADFSTSQMASDFNTSAPALSSYFKNLTGQTISNYLTDYRLTKAKQLLLTTTLPLADICKEVGYYNVSSFIRRFKSIEGVSPGAYRDLHQSKSVS